jgi:hypothetical protein
MKSHCKFFRFPSCSWVTLLLVCFLGLEQSNLADGTSVEEQPSKRLVQKKISVAISADGEPTIAQQPDIDDSDSDEALVKSSGEDELDVLKTPEHSQMTRREALVQSSGEVELDEPSQMTRRVSRSSIVSVTPLSSWGSSPPQDDDPSLAQKDTKRAKKSLGKRLIELGLADRARDARKAQKKQKLAETRTSSVRMERASSSHESVVSTLLLSASSLRQKLPKVPDWMVVMASVSSCIFGIAFTVAYVDRQRSVRGNSPTSSEELRACLSDPNKRQMSDTNDFDFQTVDDKADWQTRFWKWCTPEEATAMGVHVRPPSRPYDDHGQIDVEANADAVGELLANASVDMEALKKDPWKTVDLPKLLRQLENEECYFMATRERSSVVLAMDTIRLRCIYNGQILIQEANESMLFDEDGLPGTIITSGQSPEAASKLFWNNVLKMEDQSAVFIEDYVEDKEIEAYAGIRCIERAHVMAVKLLSEDADVVGSIGLPECNGFTRSTTRECDDDSKGALKAVEQKFKWVTFKQFMKMGRVLSNLNADRRGKSLVNGPSAKDNLVDFLQRSGVDAENWENSRKLNSLLNEIKTGKCYLELNCQGLFRVVHIVSVRVWSADRQQMLLERGRESKSGEQNWDAQLPSCRKEKSERLHDTTKTICQVLTLSDRDVEIPEEPNYEYYDDVSSKKSCRYKGLATKYKHFFVDAVLNDDTDAKRRMRGRTSSITSFGSRMSSSSMEESNASDPLSSEPGMITHVASLMYETMSEHGLTPKSRTSAENVNPLLRLEEPESSDAADGKDY